MGMLLTEIAQQLQNANKKIQLIYAFNGTGKTRLSRAFKQLIAPKGEGDDASSSDLAEKKMLYYSAFTEDLFYWDNDLGLDAEPKLKIQPNSFTKWVLEEQGQDQSIARTFQRYTSEKLTPQCLQHWGVAVSASRNLVLLREQPDLFLQLLAHLSPELLPDRINHAFCCTQCAFLIGYPRAYCKRRQC